MSQKIVRTFVLARTETAEIRWTDPKTGQVLIERYEAPPPATWQARMQRQVEREKQQRHKPECVCAICEQIRKEQQAEAK